jgi:hypothetical protein
MGGGYSPRKPERRSDGGDEHIRYTFRWQDTCSLGRHNTLQNTNGRVCPMVLLLGKANYEHSALIFKGADKCLGVPYIILFIALKVNIRSFGVCLCKKSSS